MDNMSTENGQALPTGLPSELRDFMENAHKPPSWTDQGRLAGAIDFNKKRGLYLAFCTGSPAA